MGRHVPGPAPGEIRRPPGSHVDSVRGHQAPEGRLNGNVSLLAAFAAGFLSFISPCVLPLIPGYISFVSGVSVDEMRSDAPPARPASGFPTSLAFGSLLDRVIASGASETAVGKFMFSSCRC